jgi:hypothetical protein
VSSTPCVTSFACGLLQSGVEYDSLSTNDTSGYGYCSNWRSDLLTKCTTCLQQIGNENYIANCKFIPKQSCTKCGRNYRYTNITILSYYCSYRWLPTTAHCWATNFNTGQPLSKHACKYHQPHKQHPPDLLLPTVRFPNPHSQSRHRSWCPCWHPSRNRVLHSLPWKAKAARPPQKASTCKLPRTGTCMDAERMEQPRE